MPRKKNPYPGKTQFRQAMNCIGSLIFERGLMGNLDMSVSCRRIENATVISVYHADGVMTFTVTEEELLQEMTRRQREAREALRRKG